MITSFPLQHQPTYVCAVRVSFSVYFQQQSRWVSQLVHLALVYLDPQVSLDLQVCLYLDPQASLYQVRQVSLDQPVHLVRQVSPHQPAIHQAIEVP